jgi:hypothetical protein
MFRRFQLHFVPALVLLFPLSSSPAQSVASGETSLDYALDRVVGRLIARTELQDQVGSGFNRESLDIYAFRGLRRTSDSTIMGWFTGLSAYIDGIDSVSCARLAQTKPSGRELAQLPSTMDSALVDRWALSWESAVVASFRAPLREPVSEEEVMMAMLGVIAKLPSAELVVGSRRSGKPKKSTPRQECQTMREFFTTALRLDEPERTTLFRGLADKLETPD